MRASTPLRPSFSAKAGNRAPVRIVSQRGESPRQKEVWPDEAEGNCVAAMRGGEQPKAKDSSVTQVNSIRFVTLASLPTNGEAQMTPTTSKRGDSGKINSAGSCGKARDVKTQTRPPGKVRDGWRRKDKKAHDLKQGDLCRNGRGASLPV